MATFSRRTSAVAEVVLVVLLVQPDALVSPFLESHFL